MCATRIENCVSFFLYRTPAAASTLYCVLLFFFFASCTFVVVSSATSCRVVRNFVSVRLRVSRAIVVGSDCTSRL